MIISLFKFIFKIIKWSIGIILILFVILSIIPYFFSSNLHSIEAKPYENSEFHYHLKTKFHYRVFKPEIVKYKILLIHGFSASTFSFRKNIDFLTHQECLVVAVDMPGFGYSDKSDKANYSDLEKVNAFNQILIKQDSLIADNSPWIIVGHSMGANTSAQFANQYPNYTKALIWIDGAAINQDISAYTSLTLYPPLLKWADLVLEKHFLNFEKFNELLSSAYGSNPDSSDVIGYMKPFEIPGSGSAVFRMFAGMGNVEINHEKINHFPKLIIWGKNDQWIPFTDIQKKIKGNVMLIDEAGHCPMETHPKEVNQMMINFIHNLSSKKK